MASGLDMSLDDLIKSNKKSKPSGGRASAPGPARRAPNRSANRPQPYSNIKPVMAPDSTWQHDMHSEQMVTYSSQAPAARASAIETGTKLYISNLDYSVSNEDIKELFSEVGDLKRFSIHYDRSGRSKGSGEVVFSRRNDALAAVKRYNDVQLDGKPMKIEIAGTNIMTPAYVPKATNGLLGTHSSIPKSAPVRGTFAGSSRGGGAIGLSQRGANARGRGRGGRGRGRGRSDPVSSEDLDADLEKYHSEAMQISS